MITQECDYGPDYDPTDPDTTRIGLAWYPTCDHCGATLDMVDSHDHAMDTATIAGWQWKRTLLDWELVCPACLDTRGHSADPLPPFVLHCHDMREV